jgi:CHAT domain-containing protein
VAVTGPVPILSVESSAQGLRFRLEMPDRHLAEPLQEELRHALDEATLRALLESAETLLRSAESPGFSREAAARGAVLYRTLLPARLRAQLSALRGPLLVSTSLGGVPWELLHDGEEFWGLRYAIGKRLVMDRPLPPPAAAARRGRPRALVVGSDPRGDLPFVGVEVEAICETLEAHADVDCVSGSLATFEAVAAYLATGFDIVHYCGHVVAGERGEPALLLAGGRALTASAIERNVAGRPLVFLNACASARGGGGQTTAAWEATVASVAYGFLFGGALAVVGTLADVSDRHAAGLAEEFYRRALAGEPVGEALRGARVGSRDRAESAGSPTWLSFVLYGNPAQALLPAGPRAVLAEPAPPRPVVAAPAAPRRRWPTLLAMLVAVLAVAGLLRYRQTQPPAPIVVGVMEVRPRNGAVQPWMRELTRDSLNTILSKFPPIRVFSRQKIDFVREKRGLGEIEAAETLGMRKMISASVGVDGQLVTLDLDVVDIGSGLLETSERVQGPREQLMELETELALRALRALGVAPSAEEIRAVVADRGRDTLGLYRMFSDTLGDPPAPPPVEPPAERPPAPEDHSWLEWGTAAWAQEPAADEVAIRDLLTRYGTALSAKSVDQLAGLQVEMSQKQRDALARYFGTAPDLQVHILDVDVVVEGDEAIATFTRQDVFTDAGSGRHMRLEARVNGLLAKVGGVWKIRGLREPT